MSSTSGDSPDDRTTRARVRDAAIELFARTGFAATVRDIADAAGVSPGLVIHHFGSKAGLRAECDDAVLAGIGSKKELISPGTDYEAYLDDLRRDRRSQTEIVYLLRAVADGGDVARAFMARVIAQTEESLRIGVEAGELRPSVDPAARARYLAYVSIGALLIDTVVHPPADWSDPVAILRGYIDRTAVPGVECAAYGLIADPTAVEPLLANHTPERGDTP
ncbi:MAG: TetR family transcriptional regulator [Gordonia sp. (in: high G+C Gram-positive bacteria)]|uniref:TetR/AcrR family transcriptional regulator n=1 Tax=Gordonia sp. (in: high G+C Gram-positive bacteria) TaxID=84139 RepID=UPI0039E41D58